MYEHNNVPEPTCDGFWWQTKGRTIYKVRYEAGCWRYYDSSSAKWLLTSPTATWAGPIPVPEDKPVKSEVEVREDAPPGIEWPPPGLETSGLHPPATSEDEGEKWGRRFEELFREEAADNKTVRDTERDAALRFRAECIAPLAKAAEAYMLAQTKFASLREPNELSTTCRELQKQLAFVKHLPAQAEASKVGPA